MIIKLEESGSVFSFTMQAETVSDSALLARLGLNMRKVSPNMGVTAFRDGRFLAWLTLNKVSESSETSCVASK